ncbi:MAG: CDP-diacylglycerol--glycerol-3-phosphate 3-phosphatidyltransferase [Alphaproteobacteria bacterium]|jgi:CDP-diacylglycerol--glycerol-3-phosphate 3-phosphatidyltransferase|nr:CDP-diacylglycerol--glycerol-3-phosphate 3-phosphatidyltransferase [Alphaproteobacteria bacterium]
MKQLPNILTIIRLAIILSFIAMLYLENNTFERWVFLTLFAIASITDFLDGYLARKYNISSNFGRIFDPIADKSLIIIVCIMVLLKDDMLAKIIIIPIMITILRDLVISGIREGLATQKTIIKVSKMGKYKTTFQMLALGFLIIGSYENLFYINCLNIGIILLYFSVVLSLISGFQYMRQSYKSINN